MTEIVKQWSGTAASVHRELQRAALRGELVWYEPVQANDRGLVVRVALRNLELSPPVAAAGQRRTAGGRRAAVKYVAAGAGIALGVGGVVLGVVELVRWASAHVAQILGGAVALLLVAAVLARVLVGGGDKHPCNR